MAWIRIGHRGMPPELYRSKDSVRGLLPPTALFRNANDHLPAVNLSLGYPRRAPQCRMLTPVFHPNFDDSSVCIGDFWAASESLDDLIVRIGRMISYQEYNTKSPLNGLAAKWAAQNSHLLPVDSRPIAPPLEPAAPEPASEVPISPTPAAPQAMAATIPQSPGQSAPAAPGSEDPWDQKIVIS